LRDVATKAAVSALYNVMMILEGVAAVHMAGDPRLEFALVARIRERETPYRVVEEFELAPNGEESACMGFHVWTDGDFRTRAIGLALLRKTPAGLGFDFSGHQCVESHAT
jgi:hypothetical protein